MQKKKLLNILLENIKKRGRYFPQVERNKIG